MPRPKRGGKARGGGGRRGFESSFVPFAGTSAPPKAHHAFSMSEEARNTERHHNWDSDMKLRHTKISFVSGGSERPSELVEEGTKMAEMTLNEPSDESDEMVVDEPANDGGEIPVDESTKTSSAGIPTPQAEELEDAFEMSFVVDTVGSQPVTTGLAPPKLRASSPTPSDSSEEVILFAGREQSRNGQMRVQPPRRARVETFNDKIKVVEDKIHHAQEELLEITSHQKPTLSRSLPIPKRGKKSGRNPRSSSYNARDARKAEEEAMIADYIANMEAEADESGVEEAPVMNQRDLGGSDDDIWLDEEDISAGEAVAETQHRESYNGWDRSELQDLDDLSTSAEMMGAVQVILSKRERRSGTQYLVVWNDESVDDARWVPDATLADAPGAAELIKAFEVEEKLVAEFMDAEEESDDSDDSEEMDSDDDLDDDQDDEADLVQRKMDRMTDEQIARLLAKQEELGMGSEELMLFDDDDDEGEEENFIIRSTSNHIRSKGKGAKRPRGDFPAASTLADAYDGFDVMDFERPSLKKQPKGRKGKIAFDLSDSEFESSMQMAWENDREKKKGRKQEREELRAAGLLGKKNSGKPDLKAKYKEGMQISEVESEIKAFLRSDNTTLALPPMDKAVRKVVHEIANAFNLKSKSAGSGKKRFPILYRTSRTSNYSERAFEAVTSKLNRRFLPRMDAGRGSGYGTPRRSARGGAGDAGVSYRDGDVVGASAPELGAENRGRAMLEKMGWSSGTALGALNNKGIMQPVTHVVKTTKAGLG